MAVRVRSVVGWTLIVVLATLAGILVWALTSQSALRWAVDRTSAATGGKLVVSGLNRTGIVSLDAQRVRYTDTALRVDVRDVSLAIGLGSLLRGHLDVRTSTARSIDVAMTGESDASPPQLPDDLRLPIEFDVRALKVQRLSISPSANQAPVVLDDLEAALAYDAGRYTMTLRSLGTPWTAVEGRLALAAVAPFPIEGAFVLVPRLASVSSAAVALDGELGTLGVGAVIGAYDARVSLKASVRPFDRETIASVEGAIDGLALRSIDASLPRAMLDALVDARVGRSGRIEGDVRVRNLEPGPPANERLPIRQIAARFDGTGTTWSLTRIDVDAARAGRLSGSAQLGAAAIEARLQAHGLNLAALHESLHATAFDGPIEVVRREDGVTFEVNLRDAGTEAVFVGRYADDRLDLAQVRWTGPAGRIEADGFVTLTQGYGFEARGRLLGVDPARLGDYPQARLNAEFSARGQARPLLVNVDARIADSRFRGQPLGGVVRARVMPERVEAVDVDLRLANASAHAKGSLGAAGDRLAFDVAVPDARVLHGDARGSLRANGSLAGTWRAPSVVFDLQASGLRYTDGYVVDRASGKGRVDEGGAGRIDVTLSAQGVQAAGTKLASARLAIDGTRVRHAVQVAMQAAGHRLAATARGGLDESLAWQGTLQTMRVEGGMSARLVQPVDIRVAAESVHVGPARVEVDRAGSIELGVLDWDADRGVRTRGRLERFALAGLQAVLPIPEAVRSLVVAGQWDVTLDESLSGSVTLNREAGDIVIPGSPSIPAKLSALHIDARAQGRALTFDARIESGTFGRAEASGSTQAERRAGQWGIAGDAPIQARLQAQMPTLAWARPLIGDSAAIAGRAEVSMRVGGTFSKPVYEGQLRGEELTVRLPDFGLTLRDGLIAAVFEGQRLAVQTLRFTSGEGQSEGRITGTGSARLVPGDLSAQVELSAEKLTVLARPDRLAVVSGKVDVAWDPSRLRAKGRFTADRGVIELPREDTPRPSSDVVVLGARPAPPKQFNVETDLSFDLGEDFMLRGRGLDTRLAGTLRAQIAPKAGISLTGNVRAVDGTYTAFGRKLTIRRGVLTFVGPVENPSLDILAVRTLTEVEVGVAVGGTALVPQIRLVSTPAMSDANKLAWLTLGRGLDEAGKNEAAVLQAAALALLSRGKTDSQGTLASRFGLDDLSLGTASGTGERIVTIGKRLAKNFYVGFERGITGAVSVIKMTYDLSRRWSVQARAGSENAVDLFYTLGFR